MATILIVDDDPDTCDIIARHLRRTGYETACAANGWEALIALDSHRIDLVLLDVMMPGMDGETFLKILRGAQKQQDMAVVVVTALGKESVESRMARLGVSDIVPKDPEFFRKLIDVVSRNLAARSRQTSHN